MKKLLTVFFTFIFCFFSYNCFDYWKLKGDLFDKKVLAAYELSWLEKPENVTEEKQYISSNEYYVYEAKISSFQAYEEYANGVLDLFFEKNYTMGVLRVVDGSVKDEHYKIYLSQENPRII